MKTAAIIFSTLLVIAIGNTMGFACEHRVYFGTYTGAKSKGIYVSRFDSATGKLSDPELAAETKSPSFLAVSPKGNFLYAVGEASQFAGKTSGTVNAYAIEAKTGKLTLLNQQPSGGAGPCHLAVDAGGKCLLVANYGGGSVASLPIKADGSLREPASVIQYTGSSVDLKRQAGPHGHFILPDPRDRFALACDLGLDKVLIYRLNTQKATLSANDPPSASVAPGAGPRHLIFSPNGKFVYVINEMGSTLTTFSYNARKGSIKELQTVSTLPRDFSGNTTTAEVQAHPSGKFVYGSNRGHDSIAVFAVDKKSGRLSPVEHVSTQGKTPRHFAIDPSGRWLLAENQGSDSVVVFAVDGETGKLTSTGEQISVGSPVCAVFVPAK